MAAFAIKAPLFPFHTWLPLVHTEAPTAGSVVLAGVILKMGAYGFLRFSFELFPQASVDIAPIMMILAVIGIIYGADRRRDADRPETDHRVLVGRAHGLRGPRHLLAVGHRPRRRRVHDGDAPAHHGRALPRRRHALRAPSHPRDRRRSAASGRSRRCSAALFLIALFAGIGLPGFSGFIGEFLSLLGAFVCDRPYAIVATFGVILAAVYALWAFQRAFTGKPQGENIEDAATSRCREVVVVVPLLGAQPVPRPLPEAGARPDPAAVELRVRNLERKSDYRQPKPPGIARSSESSATTARSRREGRQVIAAVSDITPPPVDWLAIAPELALVGAAVLIVLAARRCSAGARGHDGHLRRRRRRRHHRRRHARLAVA